MFTGEQEGHGYVRLSIRDWHWDLMKSYLGFHSPTLEDIIATESGMVRLLQVRYAYVMPVANLS